MSTRCDRGDVTVVHLACAKTPKRRLLVDMQQSSTPLHDRCLRAPKAIQASSQVIVTLSKVSKLLLQML